MNTAPPLPTPTHPTLIPKQKTSNEQVWAVINGTKWYYLHAFYR